MKIYVVTQGTYDDITVITATTDKSLAEVISEKFNAEYEPTFIDEVEEAEVFMKSCWFICFDHDGSVVLAKNASNQAYRYNELNECKPHSHGLSVSVLADDSATAIKIASEKRAQYLENKAT